MRRPMREQLSTCHHLLLLSSSVLDGFRRSTNPRYLSIISAIRTSGLAYCWPSFVVPFLAGVLDRHIAQTKKTTDFLSAYPSKTAYLVRLAGRLFTGLTAEVAAETDNSCVGRQKPGSLVSSTCFFCLFFPATIRSDAISGDWQVARPGTTRTIQRQWRGAEPEVESVLTQPVGMSNESIVFSTLRPQQRHQERG